jgi:membrane protein implicated in regulation of membrane protease activity
METNNFFTPQVIWFFMGLVLLLLELALPGLIVVFFGIGAWVTALCIILFHPDINIQILIFLVSSVLFLALLRKYLKKKFFHEDTSIVTTLEDEFIGKTGVAESKFSAGSTGRVHFKGTSWTAVSDSDIEIGEQVTILDKESIKLIITKKN